MPSVREHRAGRIVVRAGPEADKDEQRARTFVPMGGSVVGHYLGEDG